MPVDDSRRVIADLRAQGMTFAAIAAGSGMDESNIQRIHYGHRARIRRPHAERIAALGVLAVGIQRRVRGLAYIGHGPEHIAEKENVDITDLLAIAKGAYKTVRPRIAAAVIRYWDQWVTIDGPCAITAADAARRNWSPPWAWNDDTIDDPKVKAWRDTNVDGKRFVDWVKVHRMCGGEPFKFVTRAETREAVRILHYQRRDDGGPLSADDIAEILHTTDRTVQRVRDELKLPYIPAHTPWGHGPRGTLKQHLDMLWRRYTSKMRTGRKAWIADARCALADLTVAYHAAGLETPGGIPKASAVRHMKAAA